MKVGFIGFGEAAYNISLGLRQEGVSELMAQDALADDPGLGERIRARAQEAGVPLLNSALEVAKGSDVLFAAVPSSNTLEVCRLVRDVLRPGQLYVDVSASTPRVKQQIWDQIKDTGVLFVDAAMLGSLPKDKHKVPISASGNGAAQFLQTMGPVGMNITLAGEQAGAASAIKLVRSIFMKGIATLMIEMLLAADAYDVSDEVVSSIGESMDNIPFTSHLDRLVTGSAIHSVRRAKELDGSISLLEEAGLAATMTAASKEALEALAAYKFNEAFAKQAPRRWQEIVQHMMAAEA